MDFPELDSEESIYSTSAMSIGVSQQIHIADTCMIASVSNFTYEAESNINHYTISIEIPLVMDFCYYEYGEKFCKDGITGNQPVFKKEIPYEMIGDYFHGKYMKEIVSYDESDKAVIFKIKDILYKYDVSFIYQAEKTRL